MHVRNVRQDLADLSGRNVNDIDYSRLNKMYGKKVQERIALENSWDKEEEYSVPKLEFLKRSIANKIGEISSRFNSETPVSSVYDALQVVKSHKRANSDPGIRSFITYLDKKWQADREANISAGEFDKMRKHFVRQYPKSAVCEVIDDIASNGYLVLPVADLMHIASKIESQEDFDRLIIENGLHGNQPYNVKARKFILAALEGDMDGEFEKETGDEDYSKSRFENAKAKELYEKSLDGGPDEEAGDVSEYGVWIGRMDEEKAILIEDDQGFVGIEEFDSPEETMEAWEMMLKKLGIGEDSDED